MIPDPSQKQFGAFATTRWSIVVAAGKESSPGAKQALAALCETYWVPLYGYVRRRVNSVAEAHDLTQAFFTEFLEKEFVADADPQRGRFRAFLLTAMKHFLSKEWQKARAQKRGGGRTPLSLDFNRADSAFELEATSQLTAEQIFDRDWAMTLLTRILERLKSEFETSGRLHHFNELKPFLVGDHSGKTWAGVAQRLEVTEAAAKMAGSRMRKRYRELLREEIAQTVSSPNEVDDEIRKLFTTMGL